MSGKKHTEKSKDVRVRKEYGRKSCSRTVYAMGMIKPPVLRSNSKETGTGEDDMYGIRPPIKKIKSYAKHIRICWIKKH